jgi:hypothetical protein
LPCILAIVELDGDPTPRALTVLDDFGLRIGIYDPILLPMHRSQGPKALVESTLRTPSMLSTAAQTSGLVDGDALLL